MWKDHHWRFSLAANPFMITVELGHYQIAHALLNAGANPNNATVYGSITSFHEAVRWKHSRQLLELLWGSGGEIEAGSFSGRNPLHEASRLGGQELVEFLLEKGANIGAKDDEGKTPLHYAVTNEVSSEPTSILLKRGAAVNAMDKNSCTPLHKLANESFLAAKDND